MTILERYVLIADVGDLRYIANEFILSYEFDLLEIVVTELERRDKEDKANVKRVTESERSKRTGSATEATKGKGDRAGARNTGEL
jgi:hypothetical protein